MRVSSIMRLRGRGDGPCGGAGGGLEDELLGLVTVFKW